MSKLFAQIFAQIFALNICSNICSKSLLKYLLQIFARIFAPNICSNSTKTLREACRPPTTRLILSTPPLGTLVNLGTAWNQSQISQKWFLNSSFYPARGWGGRPASALGARHLRPRSRRPRHRPHSCSPLPSGPISPTIILTIILFLSNITEHLHVRHVITLHDIILILILVLVLILILVLSS